MIATQEEGVLTLSGECHSSQRLRDGGGDSMVSGL